MSAFVGLSAPIRALFALPALLLCLMNIGSAVLTTTRKRGRLTLAAVALFLPVYFLWQAIFDLSLFGGSGNGAQLAARLGALPWLLWLGVLLLLTLSSALLFACGLRLDRTSITPGTIKLYLDQVPCGVCCWQDNGRVLFSNICMNRLCEAVTGEPLLNGSAFRDAVGPAILTAEERVWRFSCRDFTLDGELLHEMIASDITAEYAKTRALERDKAELSALNRELQTYYRSIDETVRRQELLQARVNIHDEMNRLMLSTMAADSGDPAALDRIFLRWEQNALLLGKAAEEDRDASDMLEQLASALGIRLILKGTLPETLSERQRALFWSAAREALVNALKHGGAKTLTISFAGTERAPLCRFTNDGKPPRGEVRFTGGLANLAMVAGEQGASVSVSREAPFTLTLSFPDGAGGHQPNG